MKSKFTTAMLALISGGLGIHRFYLGQNIRGLFYLLFCRTLIPTIIACFDFFCFILMPEDHFNMHYNMNTVFQKRHL
ncbi:MULTISPECIES: TM2 domain-containing protein [Chryseobacterium]|uniref:TM2 domain-containing protein n=1 Tax=Chryseobacterium TaxID=59732 RepID=UPI0027833151|nr:MULTISPECIES: TM2 domain-containing protein [Chryseobacterium]MDQ1102220.1 TM2 domain-containing membrane protein YozV [Chryseobacterium sp. SORGH_AS_1048]MDR6085657.1 TM2 domain-containing membrane protein YozV [Chryseobacterium sp. SORGH_AS_0909]MDR6130025.1 TM2 domain-containing membrane protein YozV [Chryseobacterium sp. SORGH_AS_1175]MDT3407851.1 TM2 domain-containing membrane protein YozV [Pseudacidovorax intermedius]